MDVHQKLAELCNKLVSANAKEVQAEILLEILKIDVDNSDVLQAQQKQEYTDDFQLLSNTLGNDYYTAWAHFFKGRLSNDTDTLILSSALFGRQQLISEQGRAYLSIGVSLRKKGRSLEALEYYQKALEATEASDDHKFIARIYNSIANVYEDTGNLTEAISFHLKSLKLKEEIDDWLGAAISYNNIGKVYNLNHNYSEAVEFLLKALSIVDSKKQHYVELVIIGNLGNSYFWLKNYDASIKILKKGLVIGKRLDQYQNLAHLSNTMGNVYFEKLDYKIALAFYTEANTYAQKIHEIEMAGGTLLSLGACHLELRDNKKALFYFKKALSVSTKLDLKDITKWTQLNFYRLYKNMRKYSLSLQHFEKYVEIERQIQGEETSKKIASMQFGYQIEKKEQEVVLERDKKEEIQKAYDLLDIEKERSETLLLNILPHEVANELKEKGSAEAKLFKNVTVLFTDFKGFTTLSEKMTPKELVSEIHECFKAFDEIMGKYSIEKIKTVGDAYLAVSGLPIANGNHATDIVNAALEIRDFMLDRKKELKDKTFEIRIGINSGEAIAGIVGVKKYAYDIWGDTVNTAARMEQNCDTGYVNISQSTYELIREKFDCAYRGEFEAKNKGLLKMYYVKRFIS